MRNLSRWVRGLLLGTVVGGVAILGACGGDRGAIMLAVTTDMQAPKDVNAVSVTVLTNNVPKFNTIARVTPEGEVLLPATLAIVEPDDPNASIRIRVMAFKDQKPMVLRDVRTTVPRDGRIALLRLPLNFVNTGSVAGAAPLADGVLPAPAPGSTGTSNLAPQELASSGEFPFDTFVPNCPNPDTETWIDGECKDSYVDSSKLPEYSEAEVFGAGGQGGGACFDVDACFKTVEHPPLPQSAEPAKDTSTKSVTLDAASCQLDLGGADPNAFNVAIVTSSIGKCVEDGVCLVPVDRGQAGWDVVDGRVQLPKWVCTLVAAGNQLVVSTGDCASKTASNPVCQNSPAGAGTDGGVGPDGGGVGVERVVDVDMPSAVAVAFDSKLFFAGPTSVGFRDITKTASFVTTVDIPPANVPWSMRVTPASDVLVTNGSQTAWVIRPGNVVTANFPAPIVDGDGAGPAGYVWASPAPTGGGVYFSPPADPQTPMLDTDLSGSLGFAPITVATVAPDTYGFASPPAQGAGSTVKGCSTGYCAAQREMSAPIDRLLAIPGTGTIGLAHDAIYFFTVNQQTYALTSLEIVKGDMRPVGAAPNTFRRGLALGGGCVYYGTSTGLEWSTLSPGKGQGVIFTAPATTNVLGVAVGKAPAPRNGNAVYFALQGSIASGGGIYAAPLPTACGATGGGGGGPTDGGAGAPDAADLDGSIPRSR